MRVFNTGERIILDDHHTYHCIGPPDEETRIQIFLQVDPTGQLIEGRMFTLTESEGRLVASAVDTHGIAVSSFRIPGYFGNGAVNDTSSASPQDYRESLPPLYGESPQSGHRESLPPLYGESPPPGHREPPPPLYSESPPPLYGESPPPGHREPLPPLYSESPPPEIGRAHV